MDAPPAPPPGWRRHLRRAREFLDKDVWELELSAVSTARAILLYNLRTAILVIEGTVRDHLLLRAAALTYKTVFAIVPLLAVMLAFFKGFGGTKEVETRLRKAATEGLSPGMSEVIGTLNNAIDSIHGGAVGGIGLLVLLYTAISLLTTVEESFNHIWGVKRGRTFFWRCIIYWGVITLGPVVAMSSMAATALVESTSLMQWVQKHLAFIGDTFLFLMPIVFAWLGFAFLYYFMPNTSVSWRSAFGGGIIAGTLWELAKIGYVIYNSYAVGSNAVYANLAALPIFLLWIYISWTIVLFGAECAFADQNVATYRREISTEPLSPAARETLALQTMLLAARDFLDGREPTTVGRIGEAFGLPVRMVHDVLFQLTGAGLLREVTGAPAGYLPGRDPSAIPVKAVLDAVRRAGSNPPLERTDADAAIRALLERAQEAVDRELAGVTVGQLARTRPAVSARPAASPPPPTPSPAPRPS